MARKKSQPFAPYPEWTEARFFGFLRSALRRASSRWPPKYQCLANAKRPYKGPNKRQKFEYKCAKCKKWYPAKEVSVDHIIPVGTLKCWEDLPGFCERLFIGIDGLQVLCDTDHHTKTQEEKKKEKVNDGE